MKKSAHIRGVVGAAVFAILSLTATGAAGQEPTGPPVTIGPWTGYSFFPSAQARGPFVIIPSVSFTTEYNDNIFLDNNNRESDIIFGVTPSLRVVAEKGNYRITAGYSLTGEKYLDHTEFDDAIRRHDAFATVIYQATSTLTFSLTDTFVASNNTNVVSPEGVSTGRTNALSNAISGGVSWQFSSTTALTAGLSWALTHYDIASSPDSNTYRLSTGLTRTFTARLSGSLEYELGYIDVEDEPSTTTHTPRVGATYRITDTLTGTASAGPSIVVRRDSTELTAAASANLSQRLKLGVASVSYDRSVGTASGVGGTTENQVFAGSLVLTGLARNLALEAVPSYHKTESTDGGGTGTIDVESILFSLRAAYQFTPWFTGLIGYNFYRQRAGSDSTAVVTPVDQNRVFVGLQFGVPIRRD